LQEHFNKIGPVEYVHIVFDSQNNESRRFGFIKFVDEKSAILAVEVKEHIIRDNFYIRCSESIPQKQARLEREENYKKNRINQLAMNELKNNILAKKNDILAKENDSVKVLDTPVQPDSTEHPACKIDPAQY
jgi:RNA recognition motif-containing protein